MHVALTRLLDDLAGQEVTHALRMRHSAHLLGLAGRDNLLCSQRLVDYAAHAMERADALAKCCSRLGARATSRAKIPSPGVDTLDTDAILSRELVEALAATNALGQAQRDGVEMDPRTRTTLQLLHAQRERELAEITRMLENHRAGGLFSAAA